MSENKKDGLKAARNKIAANQAKKRAAEAEAKRLKDELARAKAQEDAQIFSKARKDVAGRSRDAVVVTRSLRVRSEHNTKSQVVDGLVRDQKVQVLSTWNDGDDIWAKLGQDRWAAMVYGGTKLMEFTK
ncbi:MAG: SH3 domain-containing protein [Chloroflexi bacterium]|nr:SH3 domain-containing protein [Chloroflexota bacterium]